MGILRYFPSAQFSLIVVSLALSAGLVYGADLITHRSYTPAGVAASADQQGASTDSGWEATLYAIQAQNASSSLSAPDPQSVSQLLTAAQTQNVTDTVGRQLLINLTNAKSQGLGDDIPTQNQIISAAAAQVKSGQSATIYSFSDMTVVAATPAALHTYGNGVMQTLSKYQTASEHDTLTAIGNATDNSDESALSPLPSIGLAYKNMAQALLAIPVPQTLVPLHLQVVNNYERISTTYADMQTIVSDPLRGLAGVQAYESLMGEQGRLFTNIASGLSKEGILFTEDEPGSVWSLFVSSS